MDRAEASLCRRVVLGLALALGGCGGGAGEGQGEAGDRPAEPMTMPAEIPGLAAEVGGATEVLVKGRYDRSERETYRVDPQYPSGTLKGSCRFTAGAKIEIPGEAFIDLDGKDAIKDPVPGEKRLYETIGIRRPWAWAKPRRRRQLYVVKSGETFIPSNVVLMIRDVKVGRAPPLERAVMVVHEGIMAPGDAANFGGNDVQFCPVHDRAQFTTWDRYPCQLVLTHQDAGKVVFEQTVRYVQSSETRLEGKIEAGHLAYKPQFAVTDPLRACGLYVLTCRRHPWQRGYLWVVNNPYVTTTVWQVYRNPRCNFDFNFVPAGRHTVEVWHPIFKPVKRTFQVEIEPNRIKEVMVYFHPPERWTVKPQQGRGG